MCHKLRILYFQVLIISTFATLALAAPQSSNYRPAPPPPTPNPAYGPVEVYPDVPPKYTFEYAVSDSYSNNFGHTETRDGYKTSGSYRVVLPDSRIQIVTYTADENGYVADVKYEGEAVYPTEVKPAYAPAPAPAPAYAPAPVVVPAPAYAPAPAPAYAPAPVPAYAPAPAYAPVPAYAPAPAYAPIPAYGAAPVAVAAAPAAEAAAEEAAPAESA